MVQASTSRRLTLEVFRSCEASSWTNINPNWEKKAGQMENRWKSSLFLDLFLVKFGKLTLNHLWKFWRQLNQISVSSPIIGGFSIEAWVHPLSHQRASAILQLMSFNLAICQDCIASWRVTCWERKHFAGWTSGHQGMFYDQITNVKQLLSLLAVIWNPLKRHDQWTTAASRACARSCNLVSVIMQWLWCYGLNLRFLELRLPLFDYTSKELNGSALFWWILEIPWVQTGRYQIVVRRLLIVVRRLLIFAGRISRNQSNVSFKISFHLKIHFVRMGLPRLCFPPSVEFPSPSWRGKVDSIAQLYPREITGVLKELDIVAHSPHGLFGEECLGYRRCRKSRYRTLTRWSEAVNTE